jgi:hypothetical protein
LALEFRIGRNDLRGSRSFQAFPSKESERFKSPWFHAKKELLIIRIMTETEDKILQALVELDSAVKTMATASPKPNLLPIFERIDGLARELPRGTDPQLMHYLQKKSYEKARLFLQGRDAENLEGSCGHV